jgi:predicted phage terminase large subunit-like protein
MMIDADRIRQAKIQLGRESFYSYCVQRIPSVYKKNRPHLRRLCNDLQEFWESPTERNLILNCPPRHGKTVTVELLVEWVLGGSPDIGVIVSCYNETLSSRFSKAVRGGIQERSAGQRLCFSDWFPGVKIKDGDGAMQLWALDGAHFSFLATSPGGTATGIGAQLLIIDDLIKNAVEAYNERILDDQWEWYCNTMLSRLETGAKQIVIQTRWASGDLSGRLMKHEPGNWRVIKMPAKNDDGTMLCDDILSAAEYEDRKNKTDPVIIAGNYQQEPYDNIDKLYGELKTYQPGMVPDGGRIEAYIDTADEGQDYLAGAVYRVVNNTAYVLDMVYTQDPMEITEGQAALMLSNNRCQVAYIESNNGGRGFSRNVERIMREIAKYSSCRVVWFHQGANKMARILSTATNVCNSVIMPHDWHERWPDFHRHVIMAGRNAKMTHDDFADMLAGIVEKSLTSAKVSVPSTDIRGAFAV